MTLSPSLWLATGSLFPASSVLCELVLGWPAEESAALLLVADSCSGPEGRGRCLPLLLTVTAADTTGVVALSALLLALPAAG